MQPIDWSTFRLRINIDTSIEEIFNCLNTRVGIERWFLASAVFKDGAGTKSSNLPIAPGDTYEWMWHGSDYVAKGDVLENNGLDRIAFTFEGCQVAIQIKVEDGVHIVELVQSEIPTDEPSKKQKHVGCSSGWTFYKANLKSVLEGGLDLRNKDAGIKSVINS